MWMCCETSLAIELGQKDPVSKENVVGYKIKCETCKAVNVDETERSLKARFSEHQHPSSMTSETSRHIHVDHLQHSVELKNIEVLTSEPRWFERGVKDARSIRACTPRLNRDGGRYSLPQISDIIIKKEVKADRPRRELGPRHHHFAQCPQQHHLDVLTDEADRCRQELF